MTATISTMVVQFGLAMMPLGRVRASSGLTSLTTRGTSGSIRHAEELSTTTAPCSAATGPHCFEVAPPALNSATSTSANTSGESSWTITSRSRHGRSFPAERGEAT